MMDGLPAVRDKEIPIKTAYWLARAYQQLNTAFAPFEEARQKLVHKFAKKDADGNLPKIPKGESYEMEDMEAFVKEFNELAEEEVEIKYNPLSIAQFGDINASVSDLLRLGRLIKDEDEVEDKTPKVLELPTSE